MCPARLFIISGGELLSKEGTTQGDPTSMGADALGILPVLQFPSIKDYWSQLTSIGPKHGHFPKGSKSYLKVKEDQLPNATAFFDNSNVNITVEGSRHLGAIVESNSYKREYVDELVKDWNSQLSMLSSSPKQHIRHL